MDRDSWMARIVRATRAALAVWVCLFATVARAQPAEAQRPLRIGTKPLAPFVATGSGAPTGFSVRLWERVAAELGRRYEWVVYPTVGELLQAVEKGDVDLAIAGISITADREQRVDFSQPMFAAGLQILVPTSRSGGIGALVAAFASPELAGVLVVGAAAFLTIAHLIWFAERRANPGISPAYPRGIGDGLWWAIVTITTVGYGDIAPRTALGRIAAGLWMISGLFLVAGFVGTVSSTMTYDRMHAAIKGPDDLPGKRVLTVRDSTAAQWCAARGLAATEVATIDAAWPLLDAGAADAVVYDAPVLLHHALHAGSGRLTVTGPVFKREDYGMAFPARSPLREPVDCALLRVREHGDYQRLYAEFFGPMD